MRGCHCGLRAAIPLPHSLGTPSASQEQRAHQRARAHRQDTGCEWLLAHHAAQRTDLPVRPFFDIVENPLGGIFGCTHGLVHTIAGNIAGIDHKTFHILLQRFDIVAQCRQAHIHCAGAVFSASDSHDILG